MKREVMENILRAESLKREGKTIKEIAETLGVSETSAWRYLNYERDLGQKRRYRKKARMAELEEKLGRKVERARYKYICGVCKRVIEEGEEVVKKAIHYGDQTYVTYTHIDCIE